MGNHLTQWVSEGHGAMSLGGAAFTSPVIVHRPTCPVTDVPR